MILGCLVLARYQEDLSWLLEIPQNIRVIIYNKGPAVTEPAILERVERVEARRNFGREAETYLHHLISAKHQEDGATIFCQGEPFSHSPDFIELLKTPESWSDLQPLSDRWLSSRQIPPALLLRSETKEQLEGLRVRTELYSLHTWNPLRFFDEGTGRIGKDYLSGHGLPQGTNIAAHFLRSAGWDELADEAEVCDFGQFSYGAIFAVQNRLLARIPREIALKMQFMSRTHQLYAYILERLWLHLFGLPFHPAVQRLNVSTTKSSNPAL